MVIYIAGYGPSHGYQLVANRLGRTDILNFCYILLALTRAKTIQIDLPTLYKVTALVHR